VKRLVAIAAALTALAVAPAAQAQFVSIGLSNGARLVSALETKLRLTGAVSVDFHGDEAAGCADSGLCGIAGTVTWDPSGPGSVFAYGYRLHGQRFEGALMLFGSGFSENPQLVTSARVRRTVGGAAPSSLCADAATQEFQGVGSADRLGSSVELALVGEPGADFPVIENFRTRCAGPVAADLRGLLPQRVVTESRLRRGHGRIDFSADRTFSAGGLTGTLHSNVVVHLGRSTELNGRGRSDPVRTHPRRRRALDVSYRIERVSGQVVTGVHGLADPDLCGPLDACGLMGSVTTAPSASAGEAHLNAEATLRHSRGDLRRALGLAPGGPAAGIQTFGYGYWDHDGGTIRSALTRDGDPGGGCSDSQPLNGPGTLSLTFSGRVVHARYGDYQLPPVDGLRTRCPGPGIGDVVGARALAAGTVPLSAFRSRRVTLRLTGGTSYSADGYSGRTRPDVTVVLRRVRVRDYVQVYQVTVGFAKLLARGAPVARVGADTIVRRDWSGG
jgi:hypothetical protein